MEIVARSLSLRQRNESRVISKMRKVGEFENLFEVYNFHRIFVQFCKQFFIEFRPFCGIFLSRFQF